MSTLRASAKLKNVASPSRFTTVMRPKTDAQEPLASIRYPEKYTMMTPNKDTHNSVNTYNTSLISFDMKRLT